MNHGARSSGAMFHASCFMAMKFLGIDYGTVRIGLAVSDESHLLAREFAILSPKQFFARINDIVRTEDISAIVVGLPLNMSGEDSEKTKEVRVFARQLEDTLKLPVHLMDERLSSNMAEKFADGKRNIDSLAAQIILQNYLNKPSK
jgi:putative holliday junction resolvase